MPARSMSGDTRLDVEAARAHFVEAGRVHAPFLARPAHHGVEPDVGVVVPLEDPALGPVLLLDHPRRPLGQRGGQATLEEVGRLNEVVVHRDHRHPDRPRLGVGQQGGPAGCGSCLDGSHEKVTLSSATSSGPGGAHDHTRRRGHHPCRPAHRRRRGGRGRRHLSGDEPGPAVRGRARRPLHLAGAARPGRGGGTPVAARLGGAGPRGTGRVGRGGRRGGCRRGRSGRSGPAADP